MFSHFRQSALSRRAAGRVAAGLAGTAVGALMVGLLGGDRRSPNAVQVENGLPGSSDWRIGIGGTKAADDTRMQIKGYASDTSVNVGGSIDFHVTVNPAEDFTVAVYRQGHYGGDGARLMWSSPTVRGVSQPAPTVDDATGMISCDWSKSVTLDVPRDWASGAYLAVFTSASGWRNFTPFVVRNDGRKADYCVVLPYSAYAAYNMWPLDGRLGKNLYYGFEPPADGAATGSGKKVSALRANKVSFDRPYSGDGNPSQAQYDRDFIQWAERNGYDVVYATSTDLHAGRIDTSRYAGLIFSGHDEYWSAGMRDVATTALARGVSLAFMSANNMYWHIRMERSPAGRDDRVIACYKGDADPSPDANGATTKWRTRTPGPGQAEQNLLGVQYRAVVPQFEPLVVQAADHWFWGGSGAQNGDRIHGIVGGEADDFDPRYKGPTNATQTLLSSSPYVLRDGTTQNQNTSVCETAGGAVVFVAGTFNWCFGLSREGYLDQRIQVATANLLRRMRQR